MKLLLTKLLKQIGLFFLIEKDKGCSTEIKKESLHTPAQGIGSWWWGFSAPALQEVLVHLDEVSSLSLPRKHSTVGSGIVLPVSGLP